MKKLSELKPEEKRILAAEACGWEPVEDKATQFWTLKNRHTGKTIGGCGSQGLSESHAIACFTPDYGNDLNDCAEFEKLIINECLSPEYGDELRRLCSEATWHATAAQRLDAFLLAKGLCE